MSIRKILMICMFAAIVFIAGCFQGEQSLNDIDPPENAEAVSDTDVEKETEEGQGEQEEKEEKEEQEEEEIEGAETVARELYLIDGSGMVASQILELPILESKEVATQMLEYLVVDGPVSEILPNGFRAVIPAGTEILGVNVKEDGTVIVDLSEEFSSYKAEDELKIIESITHTLTQFENVEQIKLWINGHPLEEMPVDGTPLAQGYSLANGINILSTDTTDYVNSQAVTMYYPASHQENRYYVPVTQHVEIKGTDPFTAIVEALIGGSSYNQHILHVFNSGVLLTEEPSYEDGILELVFNEAILQDASDDIIADEVVETLVRTLTSDELVEAVNIKVENKQLLLNENGEAYDTPVTTDHFLAPEKL